MGPDLMIGELGRSVKTEMWEPSVLGCSGTGTLIHEESHLGRLHSRWQQGRALQCLAGKEQAGQHVLQS